MTNVEHFPALPQSRIPPHSFEAEQNLLGAVLLNNRSFDSVAEYLRPEHFASLLHQRLWRAISALVARGQTANSVTLREVFERECREDGLGGGAYLGRLVAATVSPRADDFGRVVFDLWQRRVAIEAAQRLMEEAYNLDPERPAKAILEDHDADLTRLIADGTVGEGPQPITVAIDEALRKVDAAAKHEGGVVGVTTGLTQMDSLLGGLHPSNLILLAARPSMGKTTLAAAIWIAAARAGTPSAFFSLEMGQAEVAMTLMAAQTGISAAAMKMGKTNEHDYTRLDSAGRSLKDLPLWLDQTPSLTLAALWARARSLKRRHGIGLIIVDYLQLMRPDARGRGNRYEDVTEISSGLKAIAKELQVPIVALSQLSRQVEQRTDKRPTLADLRESGALEQDADVVMFLYREEYYLARERPAPHAKAKAREAHAMALEEMRGIAEVIVAKQRTGPIDTVRVQYDQAISRFSDLSTSFRQGYAA